MRMTTMQGNNRTKPSGIEIDELPLMRIRRRKKDNCGRPRPFSLLKSSREGMLGVEGIRFTSPCTKPMAETLNADLHARLRRALKGQVKLTGRISRSS